MNLVAAGAGVNKEAKMLWLIVRRGKCRQLPRLAKRFSLAIHKRESIRPPGCEIGCIEVPVLSTRIPHAALHRDVVHQQTRRFLKGCLKGCLDEHPSIAHRGQYMAHRARIPSGRRWCAARNRLGEQIFRDRGSKRNSRRRLKKSTTIDWSHTTSLARASVESAD